MARESTSSRMKPLGSLRGCELAARVSGKRCTSCSHAAAMCPFLQSANDNRAPLLVELELHPQRQRHQLRVSNQAACLVVALEHRVVVNEPSDQVRILQESVHMLECCRRAVPVVVAAGKRAKIDEASKGGVRRPRAEKNKWPLNARCVRQHDATQVRGCQHDGVLGVSSSRAVLDPRPPQRRKKFCRRCAAVELQIHKSVQLAPHVGRRVDRLQQCRLGRWLVQQTPAPLLDAVDAEHLHQERVLPLQERPRVVFANERKKARAGVAPRAEPRRVVRRAQDLETPGGRGRHWGLRATRNTERLPRPTTRTPDAWTERHTHNACSWPWAMDMVDDMLEIISVRVG
eukprot:4765362-Prymnesium_polylepis.1